MYMSSIVQAFRVRGRIFYIGRGKDAELAFNETNNETIFLQVGECGKVILKVYNPVTHWGYCTAGDDDGDVYSAFGPFNYLCTTSTCFVCLAKQCAELRRRIDISKNNTLKLKDLITSSLIYIPNDAELRTFLE